jgi:single-stranded DNA-binding protein
MYFKNSKNLCSFIGNLGEDAKFTPVGEFGVWKFSLATNKVNKDKTVETVWIPCELWGKDHPAAKFLTKGKQVSIEAYYDTNVVDSEGGKKYFHSFKVTDVLLLASPAEK